MESSAFVATRGSPPRRTVPRPERSQVPPPPRRVVRAVANVFTFNTGSPKGRLFGELNFGSLLQCALIHNLFLFMGVFCEENVQLG